MSRTLCGYSKRNFYSALSAAQSSCKQNKISRRFTQKKCNSKEIHINTAFTTSKEKNSLLGIVSKEKNMMGQIRTTASSLKDLYAHVSLSHPIQKAPRQQYRVNYYIGSATINLLHFRHNAANTN